MNELDIFKLEKQNSRNIKIGELNQDIIDLLHLDLKPQNIYIWSSRIREHCEKHKEEYSSPNEFYNAVKSIPQIISSPDYVGLHSNGNIQFVKKFNDISLVGIKIIKNNNSLLFRTIYPITEDKLNHQLRIKKIRKI